MSFNHKRFNKSMTYDPFRFWSKIRNFVPFLDRIDTPAYVSKVVDNFNNRLHCGLELVSIAEVSVVNIPFFRTTKPLIYSSSIVSVSL